MYRVLITQVLLFLRPCSGSVADVANIASVGAFHGGSFDRLYVEGYVSIDERTTEPIAQPTLPASSHQPTSIPLPESIQLEGSALELGYQASSEAAQDEEPSRSQSEAPSEINSEFPTAIQRGWHVVGNQVLEASVDGGLLGHSISLSQDGYVMAAGAPGSYYYHGDEPNYPGYCQVYVYHEDRWMRKGRQIDGNETSLPRVGYQVSLDRTGNRLAVGNLVEKQLWGQSYDSKVKVYDYDPLHDDWIQVGNDIEAGTPEEYAGCAMEISGDGEVVAVSAPFFGDKSGKVQVYQLASKEGAEEWTQLGFALMGDMADDKFGNSVALSNDGMILAVGSKALNAVVVQAYRFKHGDWEQLGKSIVHPKESWTIAQPTAVALSSDGTTLAIGAPFSGPTDDDFKSGMIQVYKLSDEDEWVQIGSTIYGSGSEFAGTTIDISSDGRILAFGVPNYESRTWLMPKTDKGLVRVFQYTPDSDTWVQVGQDIHSPLGYISRGFGESLALSSDGSTVATADLTGVFEEVHDFRGWVNTFQYTWPAPVVQPWTESPAPTMMQSPAPTMMSTPDGVSAPPTLQPFSEQVPTESPVEPAIENVPTQAPSVFTTEANTDPHVAPAPQMSTGTPDSPVPTATAQTPLLTGSPGAEPPSVIITAQLLLFGEGSNSAWDSASAGTLEQGWRHFVESEVTIQAGRGRELSNNRKLAVVLQPASTHISDVRGAECPQTDGIPKGATCKLVSGEYTLLLNDQEDPNAVVEQYQQATDNAISQGHFEATLAEIDPSFPWAVAGPLSAFAPSKGSDTEGIAAWVGSWLAHILVLGGALLVGGLAFLVSWLVRKARQSKKDTTHQRNDVPVV